MAGFTYLVAERLYQEISGSELPLTALVPSAIAHSHPLFVDTVRKQEPEARRREELMQQLTVELKACLPEKLKLLNFLETAEQVEHQPDAEKLVLGQSELTSKNVALYYAFWEMHACLRQLLKRARDNFVDTPSDFFKHLVNNLTVDLLDQEQARFDKACNVVQAFIRSRGNPSPAS